MAERTYGPRFDPGGYQGPRTDAVSLKRERPLERFERPLLAGGVVIEIVPFSGGKPGTFAVEATWHEMKTVAEQHGLTRCTASCWFDGKGEHAARAYFAELVRAFEDGLIPPW